MEPYSCPWCAMVGPSQEQIAAEVEQAAARQVSALEKAVQRKARVLEEALEVFWPRFEAEEAVNSVYRTSKEFEECALLWWQQGVIYALGLGEEDRT